MRVVTLFFLIICFFPEAWGQKVEYKYDASGNRVSRNVIVLTSPSIAGSDQSKGEPQFEALPEMQESYTDMLGEREVVIYPNPTQGIIRIDLQGYGDMNNARLLLYNIQGRLLLQINNVESTNTLDLTSFPVGMYILHLIEGIERSEWRIIKQ